MIFGRRKAGKGAEEEVVRYHYFRTPLGEMAGAATSGGICAVEFCGPGARAAFLQRLRRLHPGHRVEKSPEALAELERQLEQYLAGTRRQFTLSLDPRGTAFQKEVWQELCRIPYGATLSYGELARRLGRTPASSRAVGSALGVNPLAILIPCHRVLGQDDRLTGYGGGLDVKTRLLQLEGALLL